MPFVECKTNKVFDIDDISPQFSGITSTIGGSVVGVTSFQLLSGNEPLLHKKINITLGSVISAGSSVIKIPNHNFATGERLVYDFGAGSPIGIDTTTKVLGGISTDLLPTEVFAFRVDDSNIKLSGIKTDATVNEVFFEFRSATGIGTTVVGTGTTHTLSLHREIANTKALITIDNIIQSPLSRKDIDIELDEAVGVGTTTIKVAGITL